MSAHDRDSIQTPHSHSADIAPARTSGSHANLWIAEAYWALLQRHGLDSLAGLFAHSSGERLTKPGLGGWRERWRITLDDGGRPCVLYMKRFVDPPWAARAGLGRSGSGARSLAGNEREWIERLRADGIPCVEPVAFGEEMRGGHEVRSVLITAAAGGRSLEAWAKKWTRADRATVLGVIRSTAALVARLHDRGYAHRDLYLSHIFFDPTAEPEESLRLIDLQRVLRPQWFLLRRRVKDLAALNYSTPIGLVSRADRLRWLRYYLNAGELDAVAKRLAYRVIGKTLRIARRDRHRPK